MELRSPEAFWLLKNGILNSYPSLQENIKCDIAVIGAGITGALISHSLTKTGYNTVVLDKRDVANGSTAATTSLLQYEIDTAMVDLYDWRRRSRGTTRGAVIHVRKVGHQRKNRWWIGTQAILK